MSLISLNGNSNIPQPVDLKEEYIQVMRDKVSIKGVTRRVWLAQKREAIITLQAVDQADYATINSYIEGGLLITYTNTTTGWSFNGFATSSVASYIRGASLLRDMVIKILEQ